MEWSGSPGRGRGGPLSWTSAPVQAQPGVQQHPLQICRLGLYPGLFHTSSGLLGSGASSNPGARATLSHHQVQSPSFQGGDTEAQRGEAICLRSHRNEWTQTQFSDCIFASFLFCSFPPSQSPPANLSQGPLWASASPVPWTLNSLP